MPKNENPTAEFETAASSDVVVGARGATLRMRSGGTMIDLASGGFGYGHPDVLAAAAEQIKRLPLSTRVFFSEPLARLCARLREMLPDGLDVVYPCNSSDEAVDGALKLARGFRRGRDTFVGFVGASYGRTASTAALTGSAEGAATFAPVSSRLIRFGDFNEIGPAVGEDVCAVIVQPIFASSEIELPPPVYLRALRRRCDQTGVLLIFDATVAGLGVAGTLLDEECATAVPDVMVIGHALGGGIIPCAAYAATAKINDAVYRRRDPALHATTTGANPAACAAANAALDVIEREGLPARAAQLGTQLQEGLERLRQENASLIERVAGVGLLWSLRLRRPLAGPIAAAAVRAGVLIRVEPGHAPSEVLQVRAPLIVGPDELAAGLEALRRAFRGFSALDREGTANAVAR
jgi:putrescine aminotransferase